MAHPSSTRLFVLLLILTSSISCELKQRHPPAPTLQTATTPLVTAPKVTFHTPPVVFESPRPRAPVIVLLHGYNSNQYDLEGLAKLAHGKGFTAVSLPAIQQNAPNRYQWIRGDVARTHEYIQGALRTLDIPAPSRIWVGGFSQGGLHSSLLVAYYPTAYRGALAISPAGWTTVDSTKVAASTLPRDYLVTTGTAERERYRQKTQRVISMVKANPSWSLSVIEHPGGHRFPPTWQADFSEAFESWHAASTNESRKNHPLRVTP